jgi:hypothetical protein
MRGGLVPKAVHPRQGLRKRDRWGLCKECGTPSAFRCSRCHNWRCAQTCIRLRALPGRIGHYAAVCFPRCRLRMHPEVARSLVTRRGR